MADGVWVDIDDNFFKTILNSSAVYSLCASKAHELEAIAKALAPVRTGEYRDSIHVETLDTGVRPVFKVVASDRKAAIVEAKNGVLARALNQLS